jgi:hypothetical protein
VELPLLARERELRAVIEGKGTASSTWDTPAGTAVELLRQDLSSDRPDRRALALRASTPLLLSMAEKLATTARATPPESLPVRTRFGQVTITTTGPDRDTMDRAVMKAGLASQVDATHKRVAIGAAVVAVAFAGLAVVAGWGWVVVTLVAAGTAAYQWVTAGKEQRRATQTATKQQQSVRDDVAHRVEVFAKTRRELQDRQARVTEDMAALRAVLTTVAE